MLSTTNEKIITFYKNHPSISFEQSNLFLIELLEKFTNQEDGQENNHNNKETQNISALMLSQMVDRLKSMEDNIQRQEGTYSLKMMEMKDKYMEDIKMILSNNVSEKFSPLLQLYNQQLLDKTQLLFQILPEKIKELQTFIETETKNKSQNQNQNQQLNQADLSQLQKDFEQKFAQTQKEIELGFKQVTDISTQNQQNVTELLGKMNNSSHKGKISENLLFSILQNLYPSANVEFVGTTKETGDFILERKNKPKVLIENKDYSRSVPTEEIFKFIRDCEVQSCSGLFISNSGICGKDSYEVQVNNGNVLVYIHSVHNDAEKIKVAIDIIDHFKNKLDEFDTKSDIDTISKELLDTINKEYQQHSVQKINVMKTIKDFSQKILKQVEEIQIPALDNYLSTRYASSSSKYVCQYCEYVGKNQQAMSAHLRGCTIKKNMTDQKLESIQVETSQPLVCDIEIPEITISPVVLT